MLRRVSSYELSAHQGMSVRTKNRYVVAILIFFDTREIDFNSRQFMIELTSWLRPGFRYVFFQKVLMLSRNATFNHG